MPLLTISTNAEISTEIGNAFIKEASTLLAAGTSKPERYVFVKIDRSHAVLFSGSDAPAAFLEVKSIGFPANGVKGLAQSLCQLVTERLGVSGHRTYVVFDDVKPGMWGHDGAMFG